MVGKSKALAEKPDHRSLDPFHRPGDRGLLMLMEMTIGLM